MHLRYILTDSFRLMYKKPKVFIPRLITASLYTLIQLLALKIILDFNALVYYEINPYPPDNPTSIYDLITIIPLATKAEIESFYMFALFALIITLITPIIDLFVHAMYPRITADYHKGDKINLIKAFREALSKWFFLLVYLIIMIIITVGIFLMVSTMSAISLLSGTDLFFYISLILSVVIILAFGTVLFLAIPIAVIDKENTFNAFRKSFTMGLEHRRDIVTILIFYSILIGVAIMLVSSTQFAGLSEYITLTAIAAYILARLTQAVVKTYISVVNPYFYLHRRMK